MATKTQDKQTLTSTKRKPAKVTAIRGLKTLPSKIESIRQSVFSYLSDEKDKYVLITAENDLLNYIDACISNGIVAIDTETTALNINTLDIVGFSLYTPNEKSCYIPINHLDYTTMERYTNQIQHDVASRCIQKLANSNIKTVWFNADFDIRVLRHTMNAYFKSAYFDCYIAARLLNENELENGLKALHKKYCCNGETEEYSFSQLFDTVSFNLIPIDVAYLYGAKDALVTYELFKFQLPYLTQGTQENISQSLQDVSNVFWNIEMPLIDIVIGMEETGIRIDYEYQSVLSKKYNAELEQKQLEFYELLKKYTDNQYSISSSKQLTVLFYDELKLLKPFYDKKKGKDVTPVDKDVLSNLHHPLADKILEYRAFQKMVSTYVDKMANEAKLDGRVHCVFNQVGTDTGRFSSKEPK